MFEWPIRKQLLKESINTINSIITIDVSEKMGVRGLRGQGKALKLTSGMELGGGMFLICGSRLVVWGVGKQGLQNNYNSMKMCLFNLIARWA